MEGPSEVLKSGSGTLGFTSISASLKIAGNILTYVTKTLEGGKYWDSFSYDISQETVSISFQPFLGRTHEPGAKWKI